MINFIPSLKEKIDLGTLGFYEYRRCLKCPIGGLSQAKIIEFGSLPSDIPSKRLIIGIIFHELMDYVKRGVSKKEMLMHANDIIESAEINYSKYLLDNKLGSLKSWPEITRAVRMSIEVILSNGSLKNNEKISHKNLLRSSEEKFVGVPDKYYFIKNTGYIIEYKTASLYIDNEINPEYVEQVKFYSALLYQNYPETISVKCFVKSLDGSSWECIISPDDALRYQEIINIDYSNIANSIADKITIYDKLNCVYCKKSVICNKYIQNCMDIESSREIYVISGKVINKKYEHDSVTLEMDRYIISFPLGNEEFKLINVGEEYIFYNLKMRNKKLMWGQNSGIYRN